MELTNFLPRLALNYNPQEEKKKLAIDINLSAKKQYLNP
jgi:hypothetical protein